MGPGIPQLAAVHGLRVWLLDKDPQALSKATNSISANIHRLVSKGHLSQASSDDALKCLHCTSNLQNLHDADIVIEAIVECEDVKKKLVLKLDKIVKMSTILASNMSSISITRLASATRRPHKVMHQPCLFSLHSEPSVLHSTE